MKNITRWLSAAIPLGLLFLSGCGGSGVSAAPSQNQTGSATALTKKKVMDGLSISMVGLAQSGASTNMTSANSTIPSIGSFAQGQVSVARKARLVRAATDGSSGGTNGGTGSTVYFDQGMGLWVDFGATNNGKGTYFFEDEAKTKPAGSCITTISSDGLTFATVYEITAGSFKGAKGTYETSINSDGTGKSTYSNTWPGYGTNTGECTWQKDGGTWKNRIENTDGSWQESQGSYVANGGVSWTSSDSKGYKYTFNYNQDGSGNARIEGPEAGLPATLTWDSTGKATLVWADGTKEEFNLYGVTTNGDKKDDGKTDGTTADGGGTTTGK